MDDADPDDHALRVTCLCAAWCGLCRDYRATFDAAAAAAPAGERYAFVDIEDDAALLDDIDVDDFPTLLIARGTEPLFFGPITPQPATLARLLDSARAGGLAAPSGDIAGALAALLRRLAAAGR